MDFLWLSLRGILIIYIVAIISSAFNNNCVKVSVRWMSGIGENPDVVKSMVISAVGMRMQVSGNASKFVNMKYWGTVPK